MSDEPPQQDDDNEWEWASKDAHDESPGSSARPTTDGSTPEPVDADTDTAPDDDQTESGGPGGGIERGTDTRESTDDEVTSAPDPDALPPVSSSAVDSSTSPSDSPETDGETTEPTPRSYPSGGTRPDHQRTSAGDGESVPTDPVTGPTSHNAESAIEIELYESEGEPVATTGIQELSTDPRIGRHFDDELEVLIDTSSRTTSTEVTEHVRARSYAEGRPKSFYVRVVYPSTVSNQRVQSAVEEFLIEQAGLVLLDDSGSVGPLLDLPRPPAGEPSLPDPLLEDLSWALDDGLTCGSIHTTDVETAHETASALLTKSVADSIAISRTDHYLDDETVDIKIFLNAEGSSKSTSKAGVLGHSRGTTSRRTPGGPISLAPETSAAVARQRAKRLEATIDDRVGSISDEIDALRAETNLTDTQIRRRVEEELPDVNMIDEIKHDIDRVRSLLSRREEPLAGSVYGSYGRGSLHVYSTEESIAVVLLSSRLLVVWLAILTLTTIGFVRWADSLVSTLGSVKTFVVVWTSTHLPEPINGWTPVPWIDLYFPHWLLPLVVLIGICFASIRRRLRGDSS